MDIFTVSFFGHRQINNFFAVETKLAKIIRDLLLTKEYVVFLVCRDGEFDQLAASAIRKCKRSIREDNSALVLVLPYITAQYTDNSKSFHEYYDEIEVYDEVGKIHFKAVYQARNRVMVDRSDLVIFCVQHPSGGAYQTMRYAAKTHRTYLNLAEGINW